VHAGEAWEDVESAARRVDLGELVEVSEDLVRRSEDTWRELRATVKDLQWLEDVVRAGQTTRHRWNELVSRCLHAIEDVGGKRARRSLGNQVFVEGRGDQLVPLLVTLFGPIAAATGDVEVTTAVTDTTAHVQIAGITLEPDSRRLAARLADLAGGQLAAGDPISLTVPLELPDEATAAIVEVASGEDTRPVSPRVPSPSLDSEETVPPSAGLDIADLVPQASAQLRVAEVDSAIPEIETLPDSEESDRQTQPGMPSILLSKKDGAAGSILGGPPKETLVLEAGDDAILADPDEVRAAIEEDMDGGSDLPDIDELEQLFDAAVGVSTAVLAAADEMEAYASVKEDTADELSDGAAAAGEVHIPPSADVKTDAGMALRSTAPEPAIEALPEEASVTDTGDKMSVVVKKATKPTKVRSRGRSKKKSRSRKKRS
jgi:hypothetical protein